MSKKSPQLRFEGFTDDWEERKFGEVWKKSSERNLNLEYSPKQVLSVAQMKLNPSNRNEQDDYMKTYNVLHKGDIAFEGNKSKSFAFGRFVLNDLQDGIVSHVFNVYRPICKMDTDFMKVYINNESVMKYLLVKATTKTLMMTTLNTKDIVKQKLNLPSLEEQQKIGSFFKQLDKTIALHQRKLDLLKEQKKGYLQKMFPKNGAKVPELRFAGFADDWEERKFESLLDKNEGVRRGPFGSALKKDLFVKESPYVVYEQQNAIYDHYETRYNISKEKFEELHKFELIADDFIMSGAGTIGRISKVPKGIKKGVFNQALIRFRINKELTDSEYFLQFIRADFMQRKLTGANPGSAITNLVPMSDVKKWEIKVPIKEEQQKIGSFFKQLDDTIALHQRKLDLLKEQKKGFLQKMFV